MKSSTVVKLGVNDVTNSANDEQSHLEIFPQYIPREGISRYNNALKHLLPFRRVKKKTKFLNVDKASLFSLITFSWMSEFIYKAFRKGLTIDDIPLCAPLDSCSLNSQRLELLWQKELTMKGPKKASFGIVIWKFVKTRVLIGCVIFSISCLMGFLSPTIFMRKLLEYLENPNEPEQNGYFWALGLTGVEVLRNIFFALYYSISYRTASRVRSACLCLVYKKILRLNSTKNTSTGELINLISFDGPRLYYMIVFGPMILGGPILSICGFFYIYFILGSWALLGMTIFVSYYPLQYFLSHLIGCYREKAVKETDKRIKIVTEILTSIKVIKMYVWENWFSSQINDVRKKELAEEQKISYFQSFGISLAPTIPVISGISTFLIHVATGGNLVVSQAFSVLAFLTKQMKTSIQVIRDGSLSVHEGIISMQRFKAYTILVVLVTQLRTALLNMRWGSENFIQGRIICSRFQKVLMLDENTTQFLPEPNDTIALTIRNGKFAWDVGKFEPSVGEKEKLMEAKQQCSEVLHSINISVPKGALIGVCGSVGSGKSSLLLACLGQLKIISGEIYRSGSFAYVSQKSWLENDTLKNNILFGEKFDPERYKYVLNACALNEDINFWPSGDETEVGEQGLNLSGGQKQRVSLARALYSDRDIYFLDDPFSAIDPQIGLQIFEKYVLEALAKKTVVMVTRQIQCLQKCDEILIMKEGRIVERGTYSTLTSERSELEMMITASLIRTECDEVAVEKNMENHQSGEKETKEGDLLSKKLTQAEEQLQGTVRPFAYHAYIAACGGYCVCCLVILIILLNVGCSVFSSWWLAFWIRAGGGSATYFDPVTNETVASPNIKDNPELPFYMEVYGSTVGFIILTCIVRGFVYTKVTIRASKVLHQNLFQKILGSPMSYFERTPIGQIQNLISRDISEVDSRLPEAVETMLQNIWSVLFSFLSITLVFHWFIVPMVFLGCLYYFISKIFRVAVRDLKRIENISRAPVLSSISTTVQGLPIIHAFSKERDFVKQFCKIFDENAVAVYLSNNAMRWMAVRLDSISGRLPSGNKTRLKFLLNLRSLGIVIITLITSFLVVFLKKEVAPAFAGLALTYAFQICGVFQYTIRLMSENEARFISVERIQNVIRTLKREGTSKGHTKIPQNWPSRGDLKFHEVKLSYGEASPVVLKGISFSIKAGQKIGVVGKTGAGKSSLAVALFRLVELTSGYIKIDDVNIEKIPLPILRSHLSVIPQDPVLFSGTLRSNLDPFRMYSDFQLWEVLKKTKLSEKVKSLPKLMETVIGEGENFSVGEKQLICLARTLLRGSKILLLDEATASIDTDTEKVVQTAIEEEFKECTIITIAHRLSTVTGCDKILVMDQGMVLEFDSPKVLMENMNSHFAKMLAATKVQL